MPVHLLQPHLLHRLSVTLLLSENMMLRRSHLRNPGHWPRHLDRRWSSWRGTDDCWSRRSSTYFIQSSHSGRSAITIEYPVLESRYSRCGFTRTRMSNTGRHILQTGNCRITMKRSQWPWLAFLYWEETPERRQVVGGFVVSIPWWNWEDSNSRKTAIRAISLLWAPRGKILTAREFVYGHNKVDIGSTPELFGSVQCPARHRWQISVCCGYGNVKAEHRQAWIRMDSKDLEAIGALVPFNDTESDELKTILSTAETIKFPEGKMIFKRDVRNRDEAGADKIKGSLNIAYLLIRNNLSILKKRRCLRHCLWRR